MTEGFDTIAAISTAVGNSGISVIRISGSDAFLVAEQIFKGKVSFSKRKDRPCSGRSRYGFNRLKNREKLKDCSFPA